MQGDQLAGEWWAIRAIEASPNGLTVGEVAKRDGAQGRRTNEKPSKARSKTEMGFFALGIDATTFWIFSKESGKLGDERKE